MPELRSPASATADKAQMIALMESLDWASTLLGPQEQWPRALKTMVRFMLDSRYAMWMGWGPELAFLYNDTYARETLGVKHPWALGKPAREVWKEIWSDIAPRIARVIETGTATWDEGLMLLLERSGYSEETYHTFSYSPLYDDDGKTAGMFCVVTEETNRVIAARRVSLLRDVGAALSGARSQHDVFTALETALASHTHDLPFTLTFIAENKRNKLVTSSGIINAVPESWSLTDVLDRGVPSIVDTRHMTGIGKGPWARPPERALLLPIVHQGSVAGVFVAGLNPHRLLDDDYRGFIDLLVAQISSAYSNARAYEDERARAEALAEIDRAKTTFFSNVSHELRTPLTLMLGPLEDALIGAEGALREHLDIAHRNSIRLLKLVNSLLDFSRIEAGRMQATFQPTDLGTLTAELASVFRSAIERAGLTLDVTVQPGNRPVYVDPEMWERVVLNLLSNAFKYTMEGSISVSVTSQGESIVVSVRDTGLGIPASSMPDLFQRFHRVEGARGRTHEGTGIGLALVNELVKLHGGTIRAESDEGKGSTFTVTLPFGFEHLPADRVRQNRVVTSTSADAYVEEALRWLPGAHDVDVKALDNSAVDSGHFVNTRGSRVILAEDNADMQAYLMRLLRPFWKVEAVNDGQAAIDAARRERPDLILTDVMMPRLDGYGLLQAIRADSDLRDIPVIMLSARAGEESRVEGIQSGADDYLVKPFSARELLARVGAHLELSRVRREAAAAILEASRRSEAALLAGEVGTYYWDMVADRVYGDRNFVPIFGVLLDEKSSAPISEFLNVIHPEDRARVGGLIQKTIATDEPFETEYRIINRGEERWVIARGRVERNDKKQAVGWAGVIVDVTDRKTAEDRLLDVERTARVEAERVGRMKDEFLATLSHELRTPLNAMLGWTQILRARRKPEDIDEGLSVIERNARTQAQLIEDLLDMSRIISGKIRLDVQRVALADVINAAMDVVRPAADAKNVRLVQTIDPHCGQISGDANRLQQVLWNLLSNAVKFTRNGGRVHVVLERVNSHIEVSVSDSGQGIKPDFLPHVFERFRQQDGTTSRVHGGLGLGLAIVKQLVELHGGQVRAKSAGEGQGSTFSVSLPLAPLKHDPSHEHPATRVARAPIDEAPRLDNLKVLVVDDDRDARDILRHLLEDVGAKVSTAAGAAEALSKVPVELPDLLLSDIGMPDMDGYELIKRIRELPAIEGGRVPAVAITAFARSEDRRRALMAGYQMHIAKPFEPDELRAVCASLARRT